MGFSMCWYFLPVLYTIFTSQSARSSDFKTFKIITSDAIDESKVKYISNYHGESENPVYVSKNVEVAAEHRTLYNPGSVQTNRNLMPGRDNNFETSQMSSRVPYPYAYIDLDSPKSLQITVEPYQNDTKFKITDTLLDAFIKPQPQPLAQSKAATTKRPKKTNKDQITNKLPRPNNNPQPRPYKNIKQAAAPEEIDEMLESTTNEPIYTTQPGSNVQNNELAGSSQIGNRESQMVFKPTVIVNIRGTVTNSEGGLAVESRSGDIELSTDAKSKTPGRNIFHISQEINIDRDIGVGDTNEELPTVTVVERRDLNDRKNLPEDRSADTSLSRGLTTDEKMTIFNDYSEFSLY